MKYFIPILIIFLFSCSSLDKSVTVLSEKKNEAAQYIKAGDVFLLNGNYPQALVQYNTALQKNTAVDYDEGIIVSMISIGRVYLATGDSKTALLYFEDCYSRAIAAKLDTLQAQSLAYKAQVFIVLKNYDNAKLMLEDAKLKSSTDKKTNALIYHLSGIISKEEGKYEDAQKYILNAIQINIETKNYSELASNYYILAAVFVKTNELDKALENAKKALEYDKLIENTSGISSDYFALGRIAWRMKNIDDAIRYQTKSFETGLASDRVQDVISSLQELISLYKEKGDVVNAQKYEDMLKKIQ